jgi:BASS family bile acid:Na+ symporter
MPKISMAGIACIIIVITAAGRDNLLHVGMALVAAMFLHMTVGMMLGYWGARLFGLSKLNARTISIEVGMQNGGLASGIAAQMGKIATIGLAPAVNGPIMNTTFSLIATWWGSKPVDDEPKPVV